MASQEPYGAYMRQRRHNANMVREYVLWLPTGSEVDHAIVDQLMDGASYWYVLRQLVEEEYIVETETGLYPEHPVFVRTDKPAR